jgi:N-carbamoyl-L-amino-acid hydrolase
MPAARWTPGKDLRIARGDRAAGISNFYPPSRVRRGLWGVRNPDAAFLAVRGMTSGDGCGAWDDLSCPGSCFGHMFSTMRGNLRIRGERLQSRLGDLARIGALEGGGVCRLAFSDADKAGRDFIEERMRGLGLQVRIDRIGNITGVRAGSVAGPVVLAGSHTDTVGTGGCFDGSVGVLAALEAVETLNDACIRTRRPVAVMSFVNEEGARFMPDMMGSLVFCGDLSVEAARMSVGIDGSTVGENLERTGFAGPAEPGGLKLHSYLELHIEQGPILETEKLTIGVVEGVQGIRWICYTLRGATAHAGATPISMRRDAAYVSGAVIRYARELSHEIEGQRATVGSLSLSPNLVNVVAEEARLTVDLRNPDAARLGMAEERLRNFVIRAASAEGVQVECEKRVDVAPVRFAGEVVAAIESAARQLGYPAGRLISGAGHDAQILAAICPTAMIFIPSCGGISHNIREYTAPEDIEAGANVLLHTILALAEEE